MRRRGKRVILMILLVTMLFLLCACSKDNNPHNDKDNPSTKVENPTSSEDENLSEDQTFSIPVTDKSQGSSQTSTDTSVNTGSAAAIVYYSVDTSAMQVVALKSILKPGEELNPENVIDLVIDALSDESIELGIEKITVDGTKYIVSFTDSIKDVAELGADTEDIVLDAIAQSLLDNFEGCKSIIYRIENKAYSTVNNSFSLDQIYMDD